MFVYFLPFVGGILADKFGYGKMVKIGISVMFLGYVLLAVPLGSGSVAVSAVIGALALISIGTGLFKGNLQVMVGDLYASPEWLASATLLSRSSTWRSTSVPSCTHCCH